MFLEKLLCLGKSLYFVLKLIRLLEQQSGAMYFVNSDQGCGCISLLPRLTVVPENFHITLPLLGKCC